MAMPVVPPPDQRSFARGPPDPSPQLLDHFLRDVSGMGTGMGMMSTTSTGTRPAKAAAAWDAAARRAAASDDAARAGGATDARYVALAARIAGFYRQRCQSVADFQQQRCQAWAQVQRARCHETMRAAMLVIAWYTRDRIARRRRRRTRTFRRGLSDTDRLSRHGDGVSKGDRVRRWVDSVPTDVQSSRSPRPCRAAHDELPDGPDADRIASPLREDASPDRETKLFNTADSIIRRQMGSVSVPLFGALSFDEDESESESESEGEGEGEVGDGRPEHRVPQQERDVGHGHGHGHSMDDDESDDDDDDDDGDEWECQDKDEDKDEAEEEDANVGKGALHPSY